MAAWMGASGSRRRKILVTGCGGLVVLLAGVLGWGALRGRPLPQALWSTKLLRAACAGNGYGGDERACARACDRGVFDDTGCLGAALRVGADDERRVEHSAYAERSCRGGVVEGCREWQRYTKQLSPHASRKAYLEWLAPSAHACDLGDLVRCRMIAAAALGVDSALARKMLPRVCAVGEVDATKDACLRVGEEHIAAVDELLPLCTRGDAAACSEVVGHALDHGYGGNVLAIEALAEVCGLRGLDRMEWHAPECGQVFLRFPVHPDGPKGACAIGLMDGGLGGLSRTRAGLLGTTPPRVSYYGEDDFIALTPPETPLRASASVRIETVETVEPDAPAHLADSVRTSFSAQLPAFGRCYERALGNNPTLEGKMRVAFIVDRLGDLVLVRDGGSEVPDYPMVRCMVRYIATEPHARVSPAPPDPIQGRVRLHLTSTPTTLDLKAACKAGSILLGCRGS
jgi:hypothetical protein